MQSHVDGNPSNVQVCPGTSGAASTPANLCFGDGSASPANGVNGAQLPASSVPNAQQSAAGRDRPHRRRHHQPGNRLPAQQFRQPVRLQEPFQLRRLVRLWHDLLRRFGGTGRGQSRLHLTGSGHLSRGVRQPDHRRTDQRPHHQPLSRRQRARRPGCQRPADDHRRRAAQPRSRSRCSTSWAAARPANTNMSTSTRWSASPTSSRPTPGLRLLRQSNRAPTPLELACADLKHPCVLASALISDPSLKQVVAQTFEAGLRGQHDFGRYGAMSWKLGAFRRAATTTSTMSSTPRWRLRLFRQCRRDPAARRGNPWSTTGRRRDAARVLHLHVRDLPERVPAQFVRSVLCRRPAASRTSCPAMKCR